MSDRWVTAAAWVTVAGGIGLMVVHYYGGAPGDPEGWFAAIGFGAPIVGAGAVAFVGNRWARPMLCVAGGAALAIMSVVSIVMFPLIIAAGVMIAAARHVGGSQLLSFAPFGFAAALVFAFGFLVLHQDPTTWSTPDGGGGSSNIVTTFEATLSLVIVTVVVASSILWSQTTAESSVR